MSPQKKVKADVLCSTKSLCSLKVKMKLSDQGWSVHKSGLIMKIVLVKCLNRSEIWNQLLFLRYTQIKGHRNIFSELRAILNEDFILYSLFILKKVWKTTRVTNGELHILFVF